MKITLDNMTRPDLFCQVIRRIADRAVRKKRVFDICRDLLARGARLPAEIVITNENDCVIVIFEGREVARQGARFEDGPWVGIVEATAESYAQSLPMAA